MKSTFFLLLVISLLHTSCTKTPPSQNAAALPELRNNPLFVESVGLSQSIAFTLAKESGFDKAKLDQLTKDLENIRLNGNASTEDVQLEKINGVLNLSDKSILPETYNKLNANFKDLKRLYGNKLTDQYIEQETSSILSNTPQTNPPDGTPKLPDHEMPTVCKNKVALVDCVSKVAALDIIAIAKCINTGSGAPKCYAAIVLDFAKTVANCKQLWC